MQVDDILLSKLEKLSFLKVSDDKREEIKEHYHDRLNKAIMIGESLQKKSQKAYKEAALFLAKIANYDDAQIKRISFKVLAKHVDNITKIKAENNTKEFAMMYSILLQAYVFSVEFEVGEVYVMRENNNLAKKKKKIAWIKVHQLWFSRMDENMDEIIRILVKMENKLHAEQTMIA